jgi:hypothetical protein
LVYEKTSKERFANQKKTFFNEEDERPYDNLGRAVHHQPSEE